MKLVIRFARSRYPGPKQEYWQEQRNTYYGEHRFIFVGDPKPTANTIYQLLYNLEPDVVEIEDRTKWIEAELAFLLLYAAVENIVVIDWSLQGGAPIQLNGNAKLRYTPQTWQGFK